MDAFGFFIYLIILGAARSQIDFVYNGFHKANLSLDGAAYLRSNGILVVTNDSLKILGHAFYPSPVQFKQAKENNKSTALTFGTTFVFSFVPKYIDFGGHGLTFFLMSTKEPMGCQASQFLSLPYNSTTGQFSTRVLAVEFDTVQSTDCQDVNDNHGIDISSLISNVSEPAAFYNSTGKNSLLLKGRHPIQAWIDYNSQEMLINVSISPLGIPKPYRPLISYPLDLSLVINDYMYIGFSASTGTISSTHSVHGWSFRIGGTARNLDTRKLPSPSKDGREIVRRKGFASGITLASISCPFGKLRRCSCCTQN